MNEHKIIISIFFIFFSLINVFSENNMDNKKNKILVTFRDNDTIPFDIGEYENILEITFENSTITNIPASIENLKKLKAITIFNDKICNFEQMNVYDMIEKIHKIKSLETLYISDIKMPEFPENYAAPQN